ncbi:HAD hydrolase family protein [Sporolactobacillus nakayamae]|uniref:HAD family hydrolase n=1 Tax=Sporolactobacillus nakayamae TaxID=269670 RepID=UPI000B8575B7
MLKQRFPDLSIFKSGGTRIEVTEQGVSKGNAVRYLKTLTPLEVIAVGDSGNDCSMFQASDFAFCMDHATTEVKRTADVIIKNFANITDHHSSMLSLKR